MRRFGLTLVCLTNLVAAQTVVNGSFEEPNVPDNTRVQRPLGATWQFENYCGIADGTAVGLGAKEGQQYAYFYSGGETESIRQVVSGFVPGRKYRVTFWYSHPGNPGVPLHVFLDDNIEIMPQQRSPSVNWTQFATDPFEATSTSHTVTFASFPDYYNHFSTIDDVQVEEYTPVLPGPLANASFEWPPLRFREGTPGMNYAVGQLWHLSSIDIGFANGTVNYNPEEPPDGQQYLSAGRRETATQQIEGLDTTRDYYLAAAIRSSDERGTGPVSFSLGTQKLLEVPNCNDRWSYFASAPWRPASSGGLFKISCDYDYYGLWKFFDDIWYCPVAETLLSSAQVTYGEAVSGTAEDMRTSNDTYYVLKSWPSTKLFGNYAQFKASFFVTNLANRYLYLTREQHADSSRFDVVTELYNWTTGQWNQTNRERCSPTDQTAAAVLIKNTDLFWVLDARDYMAPLTGEVMVRQTYTRVLRGSDSVVTFSVDAIRLWVDAE